MNPTSRRDFLAISQLMLAGCATRRSMVAASDSDSIPAPRGMLSNVFNGELAKLSKEPAIYFLDIAANPEVTEKGIALLNRVGMPMYLVVDPFLARDLLSDKANVDKSVLNKLVYPIFGSGLIFSNSGDEMDMVRKAIDPLLKPKPIEKYVEILSQKLDFYISNLKDRIRKNNGELEIDFTSEVTKLLQEARLRSLFGFKSVGDLGNKSLTEVYDAFFTMMSDTDTLLTELFSPVQLPFSKVRKSRAAGREKVALFFRQLLTQAKNSQGLPTSIAEALNSLPDSLSEESKLDHLIVAFFASHDATANSLAFTMYFLTQAPQVVTTFRSAPLRSSSNTTSSSDTPDPVPTKEEWVEAIALESLRLAPPVWLLPRTVTTDSLEINGQKIPKGALLFICPLVSQRHPKYWLHENAQADLAKGWQTTSTFHPARFLRGTSSKTDADSMHKATLSAFLSFGFGQRSCPGRKLGTEDLKTVLIGLLENFDFEFKKEKAPEFRAMFQYELEPLKLSARIARSS
jgi:cytochrome P450